MYFSRSHCCRIIYLLFANSSTSMVTWKPLHTLILLNRNSNSDNGKKGSHWTHITLNVRMKKKSSYFVCILAHFLYIALLSISYIQTDTKSKAQSLHLQFSNCFVMECGKSKAHICKQRAEIVTHFANLETRKKTYKRKKRVNWVKRKVLTVMHFYECMSNTIIEWSYR